MTYNDIRIGDVFCIADCLHVIVDRKVKVSKKFRISFRSINLTSYKSSWSNWRRSGSVMSGGPINR